MRNACVRLGFSHPDGTPSPGGVNGGRLCLNNSRTRVSSQDHQSSECSMTAHPSKPHSMRSAPLGRSNAGRVPPQSPQSPAANSCTAQICCACSQLLRAADSGTIRDALHSARYTGARCTSARRTLTCSFVDVPHKRGCSARRAVKRFSARPHWALCTRRATVSSTCRTVGRCPSAPRSGTRRALAPRTERAVLQRAAQGRAVLLCSGPAPSPGGIQRARAAWRRRPSPRPRRRTMLSHRLPSPTGPVELVVDVRRPRAYLLLPCVPRRAVDHQVVLSAHLDAAGRSLRPPRRSLPASFAACAFSPFIHAGTSGISRPVVVVLHAGVVSAEPRCVLRSSSKRSQVREALHGNTRVRQFALVDGCRRSYMPNMALA